MIADKGLVDATGGEGLQRQPGFHGAEGVEAAVAQDWLTHAAAALWIVAFGGFAALYRRVLTAPKPR